jgi:hypothetical protein
MADYAISNVPRRVVYAASGVGPYAFTFEILSQTDIAVYKASTLLTLTTDYTVTINANGTGSVTLVATAGTDNITIVGAKNIQRTTDFTTGGDLFANTLNDELDNQTIFIQQVAETAERGLKAPVTDPTDIAMTLPTKASRIGKYLSFDSNGNPIAISGTSSTVIVSVAMEPVIASATLSDARTNLGLGSITTQNSNNVNITGGTITGITDLTVADGGTGSSTLAANNVLLGNGTSALQTVAPSTLGNVLTSNGTTWTSAAPAAYPLTSGTAEDSTSGTSIDFTSIPSLVKRITVMFNSVSLSGTSNFLIQLGDSGGVEDTGYVCTGQSLSGGVGSNSVTSTAGMIIASGSGTVALSGHMVLTLIGSNLWISSHVGKLLTGAGCFGGGNKTLSDTLDRIRITTVNGTDTFDAGSINILYE